MQVLTIAGSDSCGGAGIQADLKTFCAYGVDGPTAITAVTAQNEEGVSGIWGVPAQMVRAQIEAVIGEVGAVKVGMLLNEEIVRVVSEALKDVEVPVVVDPVMVATSGARLLEEGAIEALRELAGRADVVTPNWQEMELLEGCKMRAVLVTGGDGDCVDRLVMGNEKVEFYGERVEGVVGHGTGCRLSAGIAAGLAMGKGLVEAIRESKERVTQWLKWCSHMQSST